MLITSNWFDPIDFNQRYLLSKGKMDFRVVMRNKEKVFFIWFFNDLLKKINLKNYKNNFQCKINIIFPNRFLILIQSSFRNGIYVSWNIEHSFFLKINSNFLFLMKL